MNQPDQTQSPHKAMLWSGRVITGLLAALFLFSGVMKLIGGEEYEKEVVKIGLPLEMIKPLGVVDLACAALYLIPNTAVLGAVLLTGYMGGAICTHWRVGDPFYAQIIIGVLVWLGIAMRDPRIFRLLPIRRSP